MGEYINESTSIKPVQKRLLIPLVSILILMTSTFVISLFLLQKEHIKQNAQINMNAAKDGLYHTLDEQSLLLETLLNDLSKKPILIKLLKEKNKTALFNEYHTKNIEFKKRFNITHFYFHLPNKQNLLRMHQPTRYGDLINRYTLLEAERTGAVSSGLELGTLGTLTLRIVKPIFQDNVLIGYVELGKEIEDLLKTIQYHHQVELILLIKKKFLNKTLWENGMNMLKRTHKWNQFTHYVLSYSTQAYLDASMNIIIQNKIKHNYELVSQLEYKGQTWSMINTPIKDAENKNIAELVILNDISASTALLKQLTLYILISVLILTLILFWFLHILLKRTDKDIMIQNIKRQRSELLAKERADFISDLLNSTAEAIYGLDTQGKCTFANKSCIHILGYDSEKDLIGKHMHKLIHYKHSDGSKYPTSQCPIVKTCLCNTNTHISNEILWRKDGSSFNAEYWAYPLLRKDEKLGAVVTFLDISHRIKMEEKLKRSEQRLTLAMSVASDGIWDWNLQKNEVTFDERHYTMCGYQPYEYPQNFNEWKKRLHPDDIDAVVKSIEDFISGDTKEYQMEFRFLHKDGHHIWIHGKGEIVEHDENGKPKRFVGTFSDISLRKKHEAYILRQAHYDTLTNLPNRLLSIDRLTQLLNDAKRNAKSIAVLFLDLDDFKKINDTLGHETGDKLLIEASSRLLSVIRNEDTVGRLGGDEFIILLNDLQDTQDADYIAQNLVQKFREVFVIDNRELLLTVSIGIATYPNNGNTPSELLRNADSAMYHAKELGRNTYAYFSDDMNQELSRRISIEEHLHGALDRGELSVMYQPQINISTGKIIGAEALVRWNSPVLGMVSPAEFIPIAEHTGLIIPIGLYVLKEAIQMALKCQKEYHPLFKIAVNLSPRQFRDPNLVESIKAIIQDYNISVNTLELEITEGVLMSGHNYATQALNDLHDLGIELAMDDFGTGYSSLSYLRAYSFSILKIDRSFVSNITKDSANKELVNAIIAMSHALGMKVIAEGVETQEQFDYLKAQECDFAQGYLFSKPIALDAICTLLQSQKSDNEA